ncbi:MAG TPA: hypothetical protein EYH45_03690 [Candidatus Caldiarchaeum subterraneum]|uniref:Cytochrome C oxidase subunit IV n=1 Tax=Caldiarchaeum subterraneum TaxID=311458 RepID=A0A832ZVG0_CALS0|nr:hypothetical protein [Aigarchaeota archaeon]HIQ29648.1 hypothetical protein [Candidatus Caldarchaeum subterraneum]
MGLPLPAVLPDLEEAVDVRVLVYVAVWVALVVFTVIELMLVGMPMTPITIALGILGLASLKALLIALFYQHLIGEAAWVKIFYAFALLTAVGLVVGMITGI